MRNYIQPGKTLTLAAPYDRLGGEGAKVGSVFGVAASDVKSGVDGEFAVEGVFELAKAGSQAWTQGAKVYWDDTAKNVTTTSTSNTLIGVAVKAAGSADTTGIVRLNGAF